MCHIHICLWVICTVAQGMEQIVSASMMPNVPRLRARCKGVPSAMQVHSRLTSPAFQNALLAELLETMWVEELAPVCSYMYTAGYDFDFNDRRGHAAHITGDMVQHAPYFDGLFLHVWGMDCLDGILLKGKGSRPALCFRCVSCLLPYARCWWQEVLALRACASWCGTICFWERFAPLAQAMLPAIALSSIVGFPIVAALAGPSAGMQAVVSAIFGALETLAATVAAGASAESQARADSHAYAAPADTLSCRTASDAQRSQSDAQLHSACAAIDADIGKATVSSEPVHWPTALANALNGCPAALPGADGSSSAQAQSAAPVQAAQARIDSAFRVEQSSIRTVRCLICFTCTALLRQQESIAHCAPDVSKSSHAVWPVVVFECH